jgi:citrate lyase subunit beta / citryl-CoA lyase
MPIDGGPRLPRSYLYCPADLTDRLSRAFGRGADAVIADLEDSIPHDRKDLARSTLAGWLAAGHSAGGQLWVRVNADRLAADIEAVVGAQVSGLVLPKAEPDLLARCDQLIAARERELGLIAGTIAVQPLIETAAGLLAATSLAAGPRVARLGIGEADLSAELGADLDSDPALLNPLRLQVVVASAAARIAAPVAAASVDFRDLGALRASTVRLLHLGFRARTAIHPAQIGTINKVFTPSVAQVEQARELLAAFDGAQREGSGVITDAHGKMVDVAVVRSAREVLARAAGRTED